MPAHVELQEQLRELLPINQNNLAADLRGVLLSLSRQARGRCKDPLRRPVSLECSGRLLHFWSANGVAPAPGAGRRVSKG